MVMDTAIAAINDKANTYYSDRLWVASYLDGISGIKNYESSTGRFGPRDQLGASLQDHCDKFSSAG